MLLCMERIDKWLQDMVHRRTRQEEVGSYGNVDAEKIVES